MNYARLRGGRTHDNGARRTRSIPTKSALAQRRFNYNFEIVHIIMKTNSIEPEILSAL